MADKLRIKGKANQLIGRGRVMTSSVAGNRQGQIKGRAQLWKGKAQVTASDVRKAATGRLAQARTRFRSRNGTSRSAARNQKAADAKDTKREESGEKR
ncbi:MAG: hypothetical protein U5Q44_02475 [Dehalococcoidia bacterium]|nr:hypothetical protein [Dehalococcoidia bacterium]